MLSILLYVKGCLDCTIEAFNISIPAESSLLQNEVQILNAKPCKYLTGSGGDNVLRLDIADLSDHFAADVGGLALSMARSHWHEALRSAHKSCTRGHVF